MYKRETMHLINCVERTMVNKDVLDEIIKELFVLLEKLLHDNEDKQAHVDLFKFSN